MTTVPLRARIKQDLHMHPDELCEVEAFADPATGVFVNVAGVTPWHPHRVEPESGPTNLSESEPDWRRVEEIAQHPLVLGVTIFKAEIDTPGLFDTE